jgi:hypothetical protein
MSKGDSIQFSALSMDIKKPIPGLRKMGFSNLEDGTVGLSVFQARATHSALVNRHQRPTETH